MHDAKLLVRKEEKLLFANKSVRESISLLSLSSLLSLLSLFVAKKKLLKITLTASMIFYFISIAFFFSFGFLEDKRLDRHGHVDLLVRVVALQDKVVYREIINVLNNSWCC